MLEVTEFTEHVCLPLTVALVALAATTGAAALSFALGRWAATRAARREACDEDR